MFQKARLSLTAWYLLIIMLISILFSLVIYTGINDELERFGHMQKERRQRLEFGLRMNGIPVPENLPSFEDEIIASRNRLILTLALINVGILVVSGGAGYFLAGRTLRPIKLMLDEQNRFITDASHELRTPLTALKSEIEVNLRDKNLTTAQARDILKSNLEEVNNLQILSDGLLELTQLQTANKSLKLENISLHIPVSEAVKKMNHLAKQKHITIENNVKNHLVYGVPQSLRELVIILLDNAIKYSYKNTKITIDAKKTDHHVLLWVKDEGIGIPEKDQEHIFDRFYRTDESRSKADALGYGLGLSIAKKIVSMHNGSVSVKSNPNKGTTFTISLPSK